MTTDSIAAKLEAERRVLLDMTLRNPLLNYRLLRARGVEAVDANPATVFDMLVKRGRSISFLPKPDEDEAGPQALAETRRRGRGARRAETRLQTNELSLALSRRLLNTYHTAQTSIEEQGVNTLFIALGMAEWYEDDNSSIARRAPLIMVPVIMKRADITDSFHVEYDDEDVGANLSFIERVRQDFGIEIPTLHETVDEDDAEIDVDRHFRSVAETVSGKARWSVDTSSVALGLFSFQKLLMYHDLDAAEWPAGAGPQSNAVITALFRDGFSDPGPAIRPDDSLDAHLNPADIHHVVDADSSQAVVIADIAKGRDLVVQGPPGTGKSQTIVNLIADAISDQKTILFVSEKMAALEVVKRRLDSLELGDACLELHSHKTAKRAVLDELKRTMSLGRIQTLGIPEALETLTQSRDRLNRYDTAMNSPVGDTDTTPHTAIGELAARREDDELPSIHIDGIATWSASDFDRKRQIVDEIQTRLAGVGIPKEHVFWGTRLDDLLPADQRNLGQIIERAIGSLRSLMSCSDRLPELLRLYQPTRLRDTERLLSIAEAVVENRGSSRLNLESRTWDTERGEIETLIQSVSRHMELHSRYDQTLIPEAWEADLHGLRDVIADKGHKFFKFLSGDFKPGQATDRRPVAQR